MKSLFMIGSLFKLKYVDYDSKEQIWIIKLELCSEQDYPLKDVYKSMKEQADKNINLLEPGNALFRMGELDKAEKYYQKLVSTSKDNNNPLSIPSRQKPISESIMACESRFQMLPQKTR
ncbi:unnamed protein product [Didymodactylos carnosus]|uniref:Tetratricopeptide repeat protein n=1 Tax=Didymodactylos carnosus TaxID=1234261 RepID=A0A815F4W0_9BILA|nr:unnamed protein product [Didymodactylos carnosus]CAF1318859.1 unnamed protein product [Didymodactylos carnosus]CAF4071876.1 unnamed protein product [Didymodactylos carnosus]CAF4162674.1 unnamed protein product [Didymodactylos carnosus]